jgi:membrane-bound serine protease (ClpP class)
MAKKLRGLRVSSRAILLLVGFVLLSAAAPAWAQDGHVDVLTIDGAVINPVVSGYITRGIRTAENDGAACLIIELDTPGGLMDSTETIVRDILNADVPVVIYVAPWGGRAASAGVYITYASHVAAMAPATHIGAATPVAMGEEGQPVEMPDEMQRKIEEDALGNLRASAKQRGRNWEWAERAVTEGDVLDDEEALAQGVVEIVASDLSDLLVQLDGRTVALASGRSVTLQTARAEVRHLRMTGLDRFFQVITNPTVAYLLLSLGMLGLWIEFSQPGVQLPGVLGGVCILLALYALGTLPVNWAGVFLIVFAFILFAFDLFAATHLVLTTGGIVAFVAGSLLLFHSPDPFLRVPAWAIASVAGGIGILVILILGAVIRGQRRPAVSGTATLIGSIARVRRPLDPRGMVFVEGALWQARSEEGRIAEGEEVEVVRIEGLCLYVRRHEKTEEAG